jgi:hypothetical protein
MSRGALIGRQICLVLGVLSLAASLGSLATGADIRGSAGPDDDVGEACGGVGNPKDTLSANCSVAVQTHAQTAMTAGVAGVGWMLGAAAFSLGGRAPVPAAAPARAGYPAAGPPAGGPAPSYGPPPGYGAGGRPGHARPPGGGGY